MIGDPNAQTHIWRDNNALFATPLTLYGSRWNLSPGYISSHQGLHRPITSWCLHCQSEHLSVQIGSLNRYINLPRQDIKCAQCHGDTRVCAAHRWLSKPAHSSSIEK